VIGGFLSGDVDFGLFILESFWSPSFAWLGDPGTGVWAIYYNILNIAFSSRWIDGSIQNILIIAPKV
jgi:hypothetical protein